MQQSPQLTEEEKKIISNNIDALYLYLDMFMKDMTKEEILAWNSILENLDEDYHKKQKNND